jgi:4-alpha-glucanotransferase
MGLFRLYLIPAGNEPRRGAYVRYPARELLDILALESHRAGAFVVGEDLGTVEAAHRRELRRRGVLSSRVAWFEKKSPSSYPRQSAASMSTHDLPTIAGVVTGTDLEDQAELGVEGNVDANAQLRAKLSTLSGLQPSAPLPRIIEATYCALARAPSAVILVSLEDALAVPHRPNIPGVAGPPNFCRALPGPLERFSTNTLLRRMAKVLDARSCYGRAVAKDPRRPRR